MRGSLAAIAHERPAMAHPPLISQRSRPLTASPKGEAFSQVQLIPLRLFLVQGDLLGQDTDLAV